MEINVIAQYGILKTVTEIMKVQKNGYISEVIKYIILKATSFHLMIYRTTGIYMHLLFNGNKEEAQEIRESMKKCGYENLISSWPK